MAAAPLPSLKKELIGPSDPADDASPFHGGEVSMRVTISGRSCLLTLAAAAIAAALSACATATPNGDNTQASNIPAKRWNEDNLIQQNQLLPNGLRPLRYFYW
jgi:hypothetical protein